MSGSLPASSSVGLWRDHSFVRNCLNHSTTVRTSAASRVPGTAHSAHVEASRPPALVAFEGSFAHRSSLEQCFDLSNRTHVAPYLLHAFTHIHCLVFLALQAQACSAGLEARA